MVRISFAVIALLFATSAAWAGDEAGSAIQFSRAKNGNIEVIEQGKKIIFTPQESDSATQLDKNTFPEVTTEPPVLSPDGKTLGWLVDNENCCTSYPVPLTLTIYRAGHIIQRLPDDLEGMIWGWYFLSNGKQVALCMGPTHGNPYGYLLYNIEDGKKVADIHYSEDSKIPSWAKKIPNCE